MSGARARTQARQVLAEAGLSGSILAVDLDQGIEAGIDEDRMFPLASVVKLPLAGAVLSAIDAGEVDPSRIVRLDPADRLPGSPGLGSFSHPASVAVADLVYLAVAVSDSTAADALFDIVGPPDVSRWLSGIGVPEIQVRHRVGELDDTIYTRTGAEDLEVLHRLVIASDSTGAPSPIPQLDPDHANAGSARALTTLLSRLWSAPESAAQARLRSLLRANLIRHRLAPDFSTDRSRWFSKTGTFLNLRHEVGVVEHDGGRRIAVAAFTRSSVAALTQPAAEAAIGRSARILHDHVYEIGG